MLSIKRFSDGTELKFVLKGTLDRLTADDLLKELTGSRLKGVQRLCFDMAELQYISSAGLRVMLIAERALQSHDGKIVLINLRPEVRQVFEDVGFLKFVEVE
ncbi:MAG: STAS domain-containing protein [Butyrivibrio sp.]|nr:STAS domain-containing protein [Butyrivibrio sp.]